VETAKPLLAAFRGHDNEQCRLPEEIPGAVFSCRPQDTPFTLPPGRGEEGQRTSAPVLLLLGLQGSTQSSYEMCCFSLHHRNKAAGQCRAGNALCELATTDLLWMTVPSLGKQEGAVPIGLSICYMWWILLESPGEHNTFRTGE